MDEVEQIGDAQAIQTGFGQFDQRLGPITHQVKHLRAQPLKTRFDPGVPGGISAIWGHLFEQQVAAYQIHEHQHHALQEGFVYGPDDGPYLSSRDTLVLPSLRRLKNGLFQYVHEASQGAGRTTHMHLQAKTDKKLADGLSANASFEAKGIERGHHQADAPTAALVGFPKPRLGVAVSALHRLFETMHTAL